MQKVSNWVLILCCFICSSFLGINAGRATTLSFLPDTLSIIVGDSINIDVVISDFDPLADLYDFDFNVNYDETILSFTTYSLGIELDDPFDPPTDYGSGDLGGTINLAESAGWFADLSAQPDTFTLATLTFSAISEGASSLSFDAGGAGFILLGDMLGDYISAETTTGSIGVSSPAPEPTTMLLFGTGLIGLAAIGRKKS